MKNDLKITIEWVNKNNKAEKSTCTSYIMIFLLDEHLEVLLNCVETSIGRKKMIDHEKSRKSDSKKSTTKMARLIVVRPRSAMQKFG